MTDPRAPYVGRFAPTPSGPLHLGSLVTATASYLDARSAGGRWLLRIEDLDPARSRPAFTDAILGTLEAFGFEWDGVPWRQSGRGAAYAASLESLRTLDRLFPCFCTRRVRSAADNDGDCAGNCRNLPWPPGPSSRWPPHGWRLKRLEGGQPTWEERLPQAVGASAERGPLEPLLQRRDGVWAYQLAVVVDDAAQDITHIVRGADLRSSTPAQRLLQQALGCAAPLYLHLPLVTEADGAKLSKSTHALPVDALGGSHGLWEALRLLRQNPPTGLRGAPVQELWQWGVKVWDVQRLAGIGALPAGG